MSITYCTYFNITYLPKGLALIESLNKVIKNPRIVCLCLDSQTYSLMRHLKVPGVILLTYKRLQLEYPELKKAELNRPLVEYFWTQTPFLCRYILKKYKTDAVYLDADIVFYESPQDVLNELADYSIGICPHWHPYYHNKSAQSGRFNVGWNYFKNDRFSRIVLKSWSIDCLKSCAVNEITCGDQKYLNKWPSNFERVQIIKNQGVDCAPWNFYAYKVDRVKGKLYINGEKLIFFHFHGLSQFRNNFYWPNISYPVTFIEASLYLDYIRRLKKNTTLIKLFYPHFAENLPSIKLMDQVKAFIGSLLVLYKSYASPKQNEIV